MVVVGRQRSAYDGLATAWPSLMLILRVDRAKHGQDPGFLSAFKKDRLHAFQSVRMFDRIVPTGRGVW